MHFTKCRLSSFVAITAAALLLGGCSGGSSNSPASASPVNAIVNVGSTNQPVNLDQIQGGSSGITEVFTGNVYEGLFRITDDAKVKPLLAKSTTVSPDGLIYTFKLQKAKFHSGATLTAQDVKYSLERFISGSSVAARKKQLSIISTVTAVDEDTVAVRLKQKSISFTYNLGYVWIVNHAKSDYTTTEDGTGPYKLKSYRKSDSISLSVNNDYWGQKPKNGGVIYKYYADDTALNNALLSNAVDVVTGESTPDSLTQFSDKSRYNIIQGTSTTKELLAFNDKTSPFNDIAVRRAITAALDRKKILNSVWAGYGQLIGSMVPPSEPWYLDLANNIPYSVSEAKALLAKSGHANGFSFTLKTPNDNTSTAVAQLVKSQLAQVGITVSIDVITSDQWSKQVYTNHDFQATIQTHVNDRDINFYGDPNFYFGYDNKQVQQWLNQAESASTTAEQTSLVKKANQQISDDAASVWLYLAPQIRVARTQVNDVPKNGLNSLFYVAGITKA